MELLGLHHITAMASDARANVAFYTKVLGLRLVKKTVNFDDPGTYHLYYGDRSGAPGTILTFFPWKGARRGAPGNGQVTSFTLRVPPGALDFWEAHLRSNGVEALNRELRFGEAALGFVDPDGFRIALVESELAGDGSNVAQAPGIAEEHAIRGVHSATLSVHSRKPSADLLERMMEARREKESETATRYVLGSGRSATFVDLEAAPDVRSGTLGAGIVHHIAWRTPDDEQQLAIRAELVDAGFGVSPVMDRKYFHSIYFREPGGILFEIATDPPGFAVDEKPDALGTQLMLPEWLESSRGLVERNLPSLEP